ncbi:MAG: acylneuraminate cytidylyltransferase family protein [Candidatus Omnitrophica bacterium]|nr:acylneuraminate cytidylyltransferase family protein [Candidatus Omnitrophota bacterium]
MLDGHSILAVIPAKGKSSRLPGKNIKPFAGKPLIAWTILASKKSRYLDEIIVSTENEAIARIARQYAAHVPFKRPAYLARGQVSSIDVARHASAWFIKHGKHFDLVMLLQPTSPLRTADDIDEAIKVFLKNDADALISVVRAAKSPFWLKTINKKGYVEDLIKSKARQKMQDKTVCMPNGAVYIFKTGSLLSGKKLRTGYYLMDDFRSIDIDDRLDFKIAQWLMRERSKKGLRA